jgi:hypothetical protein
LSLLKIHESGVITGSQAEVIIKDYYTKSDKTQTSKKKKNPINQPQSSLPNIIILKILVSRRTMVKIVEEKRDR